VVYVREYLWPAQDAGRHRTEGWCKTLATPPNGWKK
jgi:hypothetical protein